jgi:tetratricopeptide (TPR) repeat protein
MTHVDDSPDAARRDRPSRTASPGAPEVRPRPAVRGWLLAGGAAAVLLGAAWWGVQTFRHAGSRAALAALQPVAASVPVNQLERREAMEIADRLLRDFPGSPEALYARGLLLIRHGFNEEAAKTWQACLALAPDLAPAYEFLGIEAFQRGDSEQAVEFLQKAVQLDPQSAAAGLYLGEALNNLGRMDEAIPVLERFLQVSPHTPEPYFQLGQSYLYLKDYARAKEYHQAAVREDPGFAQAYFGLAQACERLGEPDQARQYRQRHLDTISRTRMAGQRRVRSGLSEAESREALSAACLLAGKIYLAHGKQHEAEEYFRRAAAVDPQGGPPAIPRRE